MYTSLNLLATIQIRKHFVKHDDDLSRYMFIPVDLNIRSRTDYCTLATYWGR